MNAEARRVTKAESWTAWESQVVSGLFPLRRFLGGSNHSAVFLTEHKALGLSDVAIKFVAADTLRAEAQLVQWGAAATVSHPHLLRVYDAGRCQLGGRPFLFAIMEYADQTLAQILPKRALSPDEVRELLVPTLDALSFLHRNHMVQGQLKPSNVLVVGDKLKLAGDTLRPIGTTPHGIFRTTVYDAPELKDGQTTTAGDIWALGITLVEALTQRPPGWTDQRCEAASLPANLPSPFLETIQRCMNRIPMARPSVDELEAEYRPAPQLRVVAEPSPPAAEATSETATSQSFNQTLLLLPAITAALLIFLVAWLALRSTQKPPEVPLFTAVDSSAPAQSTGGSVIDDMALSIPQVAARAAAANAVQSPSTPELELRDFSPQQRIERIPNSDSRASGQATRAMYTPSESPAGPSFAVLHEVTPDVPRSIQNRIRGTIKLTVRVLVDPSGTVVGDLLDKPGTSRYFARLARNAAADWKFAAVDDKDARVWLLHFEFTRGGVSVNAAAVR